MREIMASQITDVIENLCIQANEHLPEDVKCAIKNCRACEDWEIAQGVLDNIIENFEIADEQNVPICQDTGMACVFLEIGQDVHITGGDLSEAVNEGVRRGYDKGYLRKSVVKDPVRRGNTGDNTPAMIYTEIVPGEQIKITVGPKGFGSENMSAIRMFKPSAGLQGIKDFILETVETAGPNPCPPMVVGVGIGGTFDKAALLAKKALMRPIDSSNEDPYYADLEVEMLDKINKLGIGPQGFGGNTTAIGLNIETMPTHIAGMPCAININCHVTRRKTEVIQMEKHITLPLTEELAKTLHAGDTVYVTGTIYTSRDAGHKRMCEALARGEELPFDPTDATIYYVGPTPAKPGQVIGSAGPTTSGRMDAYAPTMMSVGARGMIGKGARLPEVIEAMKKYSGVYFGAIGGAGALLAKCIKKAELIAYEDLGAEALRKLYVEDMPLFVIIDSEGKNLYEEGRAAYLAQHKE